MQEPWEAEEKRLTLLAALLLPLSACTVKTAKGKDAPLTAHIILESIKWKRRDAEDVAALHAAAPGLLQVHHALQARPDSYQPHHPAHCAMSAIKEPLTVCWHCTGRPVIGWSCSISH